MFTQRNTLLNFLFQFIYLFIYLLSGASFEEYEEDKEKSITILFSILLLHSDFNSSGAVFHLSDEPQLLRILAA